MSRLPRLIVPGQPHHVIQRGNNRQPIFADPYPCDCRTCLEWLEEASERFGLQFHAYVLMINHVHLLVTPRHRESIGRSLQAVGRRYVQYFNYYSGRTGTLWEGWYRSTVIEAEACLLACSRYIELNPVRAGLVRSPAHYRWSSYRGNVQGKADALLSPHPAYRRRAGRIEAYRALFRSALGDSIVEDLREATNTGWALGNDRFKAQLAAISRQVGEPITPGSTERREPG